VEAQKPSVSFGVDEEKGIIFSYQSDNNNTPSINTDGEKLVYKEVEKNIDLQLSSPTQWHQRRNYSQSSASTNRKQ
jgi:hypothetical protein